MRQGDVMSPVLFSMFLNDLATGIKELNCGIKVNNLDVSILLYADDIVLIAPNETSLQKMLDYLSNWCRKWRMAVNKDKTKIIHFRPKSISQTMHDFRLDTRFKIQTFYCQIEVQFLQYSHTHTYIYIYIHK